MYILLETGPTQRKLPGYGAQPNIEGWRRGRNESLQKGLNLLTQKSAFHYLFYAFT